MNPDHIPLQRVNFGPYHPALKGMVRFMLELDGEIIQKNTCYPGFTHKGIEKLLENKPFLHVQKIIENVDQNFLTPYNFSYALVLAIERMLDKHPPVRGQFIRVMLAECGRILSHLHQIASIAESIDFGLVSSWSLNLVETLGGLLLEIQEGYKVHLIPGGVTTDLPVSLLRKISLFLDSSEKTIKEIKSALLGNVIFKLRTAQVGIISEMEAVSWGLSGPSLRASRVAWDLRRAQPYDVYPLLSFKIPLGVGGDSFDRTAVRIEEMIQSIFIVRQCIDLLPAGDICDRGSLTAPSKERLKESTEALIYHHKWFSEGAKLPASRLYVSVEGARGESGLFLSTKDGNTFDRVRLRTPGFFNLQTLESFLKGSYFSDLPTLLASFDIYSAEVDR